MAALRSEPFQAVARVASSIDEHPDVPVICKVDETILTSRISSNLIAQLPDGSVRVEAFWDPFLWLDVVVKGATVRIESEDHGPLGYDLSDGIDILIGTNDLNKLNRQLRSLMRKAPMMCNPVFDYRPQDTSSGGNRCFVIMPFSEPWSNRVWKRHLRPVIESAGFSCMRGDDIFDPNVVVDDVWREIVLADIIVADLTGGNPNVLYELGLVHAVGTPVILLSQNPGNFDIAHWRQIRYQDNHEGYKLLASGLTAALGRFRSETSV